MRSFFLTILACWFLSSAAAESPDFAKSSNWFGARFTANKRVDVLYFAPTSINDNSDDRSVMSGWMAAARTLFGESCDFYAPYYRQVPIEAWGTSSFDERYAVALSDAKAAFDYYMKYHNHGRPFILAGHSQGALLVYSLLQTRITAADYKLMVAAYPIGYSISRAEVEACPYIVPARGITDIGVCISFNSVAVGAKPMFPNNHININPLSWSTDTVSCSENLGSVFFDANGQIKHEFRGTISVRYDATGRCLRVSGLDSRLYYHPYLGAQRFGEGNYHLYELSLYFRSLQQNVEDRIRSYLYKHNSVP